MLLIAGKSEQSEELTWGSHNNKSFMEIVEAVYEKDKKILDSVLLVREVDYIDFQRPIKNIIKGDIVYLYPFGLCVNFVEYDPNKDFSLTIFRDAVNDYDYARMFVFVTDPAMLTYSSIDQQSHQGTKLFGLKSVHKTIYDVEVVIKDSDNPAERDSCSMTSFADCLEEQTSNFFSQVALIE